jgi:hypothetical protein
MTPPDYDNDTDYNDNRGSLAAQVGEMRGRLSETTRRLDRHETLSETRFTNIESKIDRVAEDTKNILLKLAEHSGGKGMLKSLATPASWVAPALVTMALAIIAHLLHVTVP